MELNFNKMNGLIPAIIQDNYTQKVLMLGFMNKEAYEQTLASGKVTFFSRTKNRLWTKGEESGNFLNVVSILPDCDNDTLLIKANPCGPVCHKGTDTCWGEKNEEDILFLKELQNFIEAKKLYKDAVFIDPKNARAHTFLGILQSKDKEHDNALKSLETAVSIDPNNVDIRYNLALAYEVAGRKEEAKVQYNKVLEADPNHKEALNNIKLL